MIEVFPESSGPCIGFRVSGEVTAEDYDVLLGKIDEALSAQGRVNILVMMGFFIGWSRIDAAKADLGFGNGQYRQVKNTAFVGGKNWQEWAIKVMNPFTRRTDERFFNLEQLDEAWSWVKEEQ